MSLPYGTTMEGERLVLITEELFMSLLEESAMSQDKEYEVEWGGKTTATITFFMPTVYEQSDELQNGVDIADPLTLEAVGD